MDHKDKVILEKLTISQYNMSVARKIADEMRDKVEIYMGDVITPEMSAQEADEELRTLCMGIAKERAPSPLIAQMAAKLCYDAIIQNDVIDSGHGPKFQAVAGGWKRVG